MRLLIAAACLATAASAETVEAPTEAKPAIAAPFERDFVVAEDKPVVLKARATMGETVLSLAMRYRRTGRLANDTTFSMFGFGKRTIPAGTPMYFKEPARALGLGVPISLWCAPSVSVKGREQPMCLLYRDTPLAMNRVELIDVAGANPWLISSFKLGQVSAPSPEIREEDVDFPTVVTQRIEVGEEKNGQLRIESVTEAVCERCSAIKMTEIRSSPIQSDGSARFNLGEAGALILRPVEGGAYEASLEGPLAARVAR